MTDRFSTLRFERRAKAPVDTLWQVWTAPEARAVWAAPSPEVTVEFLESDPRAGGREVSICRVAGQPDIRCEAGWLEFVPARRSIGYEVVSCAGATQSAALVTADFHAEGAASRLEVTVQLSAVPDAAAARDMAAGYRHGFEAGLGHLADVAGRTMILRRDIAAPRAAVFAAWMTADRLPLWWGPDGYTCRTRRIDLRAGGEWLFDMVAPDGTLHPTHHRYRAVRTEERIAYALMRGENGPVLAEVWAGFEALGGATRVTLGMVFGTAAEHDAALGYGAAALGLQTLGKLARAAGAA